MPIPMRRWMALVAVGFGVFTVTTTEMMPIGLLSDIASNLRVSEGMVGQTVTLYGIFAGLLAPVLAAATRRVDRRLLLLLILSVFVIGNALTALATSYPLLMLFRLAIGFIHGLMWAIVASIAVRLVPPEFSVRATAIVFSGISLASVLGVPLGTFAGGWLGWRAVFAGLAICSGISFVAAAALVPPLRPEGGVQLSALPRLMNMPNFRIAVIVTAVVVAGDFAAYTYITPFLLRVVRVEQPSISVLLLGYGIAGVLGNFIAGVVVGRNIALRKTIFTFIACLSGSMACLLFAGTWKLGAVVFLLVWGVTYSALPVALQTLVLQSVPHAREAATSIYVLAFNVSISLGALFGGVTIDHSGPVLAMITGIALCTAALGATAFLRVESTGAPTTK